MVTQLHLALILAIDARLLVLDEPTLGLDLLYRRKFYDTLLNDYFDKERTILLTTHQVEEVENLLHRRDLHQSRPRGARRLGRGPRPALPAAHAGAASRRRAAARCSPFYEREVFGRVAMFFEGRTRGRARRARRAAHALDRRPVRRQDAGDGKYMNSTFEAAAAAAPRSEPSPAHAATGRTLPHAGAARVLGAPLPVERAARGRGADAL